MVELEREKNQLEDDLLMCLGKIDRMQKKTDEMTVNENHDAEFIARVMNECDRVLAEKKQHSEENRKLKQRVGELKLVEQKVRDEKKAALKAKTLDFNQALDWQLEQNDADRIRLKSEKKSLEWEVQQCKQEMEPWKTKESLNATIFDEITDQSAQQIADLTAENTRLEVCAESSTPDRDSVCVALHEALEQNYQLQNELEEQEKRNAELHFKLPKEKEKLTVREQENSMLERRVKELSVEIERTHMRQLERVLTCVSEASRDKDAPQRLAGEDNSQILTETQEESKMNLPTDHEITDATENAGDMSKSLQEYGNTEFDDAFTATQEEYQKIRRFWGHVWW